nr:tail fiber [uncultured Mediterranean phage uvMED]
MAITRPTGEQLRFVSVNTGEHVLDTYMENAEIGGRQLSALLGDIFKSSDGLFDPTIFTFQVDVADNNKLEVRVGTANAFVETGVEIFNGRGSYATSTAYKVLDIVTQGQDTFVCTVAHTSSNATPDLAKFQKIINGAIVADYANKVDGAITGSEYSAKAWAIGGTGVDTTDGSAKDWATKTSGAVGNSSDFSAKYYATNAPVTTVASGITNINTVAGAITNVNSVGGAIANVNAVATDIANVNAVAGDATDIGTVSANISNVNAVAGISASVTAVAADATDIGVVATDLAGSDTVGSVAGSIANVNSVAGALTAINAVNANATNVNKVATIDTNVTTVAGIDANVTAVAGALTPINNVNGALTAINNVNTNLADVNNFANTYFISGTAPTGSNIGAGDLWYDTTATQLKVYNGSAWVTSAAFSSINLQDLANVAATAPSANQVPVFSGSAYTPTAYTLQALTDVGATTTNNITVATPTATGHAATKGYVDTEVANLVSSAPAALDTLDELAAALGDDANFASTTTNAIATKLPLAGGSMTGDVDFDNNKATDVTLENFQEVMASNTNVSGAVTVPDATNNVSYTLTGDTTVTLPDTDELPAGTARTVTIFVKQDGTGGRTFTFAAPTGFSIKYNSSSTQPAVQTAANKETIYTALLVKGSTTIYVSLSFYEA